MFQGTGSDVGKSLHRRRAGARLHAARPTRVRPFKPQNMSNNAAVTADGGEIGRAQALQARAAGVAPTVHMNPVLLKPQSEIGAQVVVQGRCSAPRKAARIPGAEAATAAARAGELRPSAARTPIWCWSRAPAARRRSICARTTSPTWALRARPTTPVVLIGDIDRGGVIASLVGTKRGARCRGCAR